jgi:hypothetical protein
MAQLKYNKQLILQEIFREKFKGTPADQKEIPIYFDDIRKAGLALDMELPVSYSNFVLDLCRKNNGIKKRVPPIVIENGYDLKKATGTDPGNSQKLVGVFVHVGLGNEINSWITWPNPRLSIEVDSSNLHSTVRRLLRRDEAAMFSLIDYLDLLTIATENSYGTIHRLQSPMKWQPNEIDGMYFADDDGELILFPVEAKALTTNDEINMDQLSGGFRTVQIQVEKINLGVKPRIQSVAALMTTNGIRFAFFPDDTEPNAEMGFDFIEIIFNPPLEAWS